MSPRTRARTIWLLVAAVAVALVAAGCSSGSSSTSKQSSQAATPAQPAAAAPAPATGPVAITLDEFSIDASASTIRAGKVTFKVTNTGKVPHEFVILRTATTAGMLTMKHGEASEAGHVGEISNLNPGRTATLTLKLPAGHYAAICNFAGHYQAGMHADLTTVAA